MPARNATSITHSAGSVTTTSGTVLTAAVNRRYILIQNTNGTAPVWLRLGTAAAVANQGVGLAAFGSVGWTYEMSDEHGNIPPGGGPITAIAPTAGSGTVTLAITVGL